MSNCHGICCADGVDVDIAERDRILEHADMIRQYMDETQDRDTANWFQEPKPGSGLPVRAVHDDAPEKQRLQLPQQARPVRRPHGRGEGPAGIRISEAVLLPGLSGVHPQRHALGRRRAMPRRESMLRPREERTAVDPRHLRLRAGIHARQRWYCRASKMAADRAKTSEQPSDRILFRPSPPPRSGCARGRRRRSRPRRRRPASSTAAACAPSLRRPACRRRSRHRARAA